MTEVRSLIAISEASRMLAEAKTLEDVRTIRDLAEAARVYARAHALGLEAEQHAADIKVSAEEKAGELLRRAAEAGERANPGDNQWSSRSERTTLADLGISESQSHRWQTIASLGSEGVRDYIDTEIESGRVPTSAGAYERAKHRLAPLMSSESPEWYTPAHILAAVVATLGEIDLDPCADPGHNVPARRHFTEADDGLAQDWRGRVYMNPPYGRDIVAWIDKLAAEFAAGRVTEAIALVPGRIDTTWWRHLPHRHWLAVSGRLAFSGHENSAPFPSVVAYLGPNANRFREVFGPLGDGNSRWEAAA